jgi:DNA (cytosine-5)-methyltransferase 1
MNALLRDKMETYGFRLTSIDLFSGPGGLATGFKWAGILPLIAVEWTDTTAETYSVNHYCDVLELKKYNSNNHIDEEYLDSFCVESDKSVLIHGDINLVTNEVIRRLLIERFGIDCETETIDIVSGGAPCESFSLAGQRKMGDARDDLFSNISRIARAVKSKAILFENVKGMFSKQDKEGKKGAIFDYICDTFDDENQEVSYKLVSRNPNEVLLKACDYGVPQLRERLFLVSIRRDIVDCTYRYPLAEYGENKKYPYVTVADAIYDLPKVESGEEATKYTMPKTFSNIVQERFLKIMRGIKVDGIISETPFYLKKAFKSKTSLSFHKGPGHIKRKQELLALIPPKSSMKTVYEELVNSGKIDDFRHLFPNTIYGSRNRRLVENLPSYTITSHCLDEMLHPFLNRAITPREAARLQSFPDWYYFAGPYVQFHGSKEEDKYEQIGDAIPPLLAYALGKEFINCLVR